MKRFFLLTVTAAVFFSGLGALVESVSARFTNDDKAMEIIAKARQAIGGDAAIANVRGIVIKGRTTNTIEINGNVRTEQGETEIAMMLPDKMMKRVTIGNPDNAASGTHVMKRENVIVVRKAGKDGEPAASGENKFVIKKTPGGEAKFKSADGEEIEVDVIAEGAPAEWNSEDGKKVFVRKAGPGHPGHGGNDMLRTLVGLLVTAPEGMEVSYTFGGETTIEGVQVNTVVASSGGSDFKLYIDRFTNMPVGLSYIGRGLPRVMTFEQKADGAAAPDDKKRFKVEALADGPGEAVEHFVRFGDFRYTGSVQLPYRWTTSVGGKVTEVFDIVSYEINPANLAERMQPVDKKVWVEKPGSKK